MIDTRTIAELCQRAYHETPSPVSNGIVKGSNAVQSLDTDLDILDMEDLKRIFHAENLIIHSVLPCSPIQEGFLTSQSTNPNLYQCCFVMKFSSHHFSLLVNARRLGTSWNEVVKRHASLRTVLIDSHTRPGHFDQVILVNFTPVEFYEWTQHHSSPKFDTSEPVAFNPLSVPHRIQLAQASPNEVYMKLEVSHALIDGQSVEVLFRDLCAAYRGIQLPNSPLSYGDFVSHQSQISTESSRVYWSKHLSDAQPFFLPMDRDHEKMSGLNMLRINLEFDDGFLQEFCDAYGVTLANVCQLAWALVLQCFTGSDNVSFSYITSGRSAPLKGIHDAVGPFISTLICSLKLDCTSRIGDVLKRISKDSFESFSHTYTVDSDGKSVNHRSARQWGNSTMSFQRALDTTISAESAIAFSVIEKLNPTDVSQVSKQSISILILISMISHSRLKHSEMRSTSSLISGNREWIDDTLWLCSEPSAKQYMACFIPPLEQSLGSLFDKSRR